MPIDTSLDDLKRQAEIEEDAAAEAGPEDDNSNSEDAENPTSTGADTGEFTLTLEDDEPTSTQESVPVNVHIHKLKKAKARAKSAESELDELKARLERMEAAGKSQEQTNAPEMKLPKLSEFDHDEDLYAQAMANYLQSQAMNATHEHYQREEQQRALKLKQQALSTFVDEHINRAGEFIRSNEKAGLSADMYLQAEEAVRNALDPDGKGVFDQIVAGIGEGSEKVTYYLGRNPGKLLDLQRSMRDNPDGISVLLELGTIKAKLEKRNSKRVSGAPSPDEALSGGTATSSSPLLRKIKEAEAKGDVQAVISLRKQAREANIELD